MVSQHYISIGPMYCVMWVVDFLSTRGESVTCIAVQANTRQSPNAVSMLGQRWRRCANIETILVYWGAAARSSVGPASWTIRRHRASNGLRHWPNIEPKLGEWPIHRVYRRDTCSTTHWQALNDCWSAPAILAGWFNVEDIYFILSPWFSLIISWTFWPMQKTNTVMFIKY